MKKMRWHKVIFSVLATLAFGIMGYLAGRWILGGIQSGQLAWWHSLGKPPGGAVRFLGSEPYYSNRTAVIYVETLSGKVFRCCTQGDGKWEETNPPKDQQVFNCRDSHDPSKHPAFSNLSGRVEDCTRMIWSSEWSVDEDFFVILADGSVWKWRYYAGFDQSLGFWCGTPALAIVIGWGIIALIKRIQRSKSNFGNPR